MKLFSLLCGLAGSLIVEAGWASVVVAEIVPDTSLSQSSRVTASGGKTAITAGTRHGRNLFHSFREFSVNRGETASFQGVDSGVSNIFARVTGRNRSQIDGGIEVLQLDNRSISPANLFLINPNGIIFGKNASLKIGGSFIATTADSIDFADGTQFNAVNSQASPLLTMSVPTGLQFGNSPGRIVNRSITPRRDETGNIVQEFAGLAGSFGRTFALVGGNVTLTGQSSIRVDSGRIEIGSVAGNSRVTLTPMAQGWDLGYGEVERFGDVQLLNRADITGTGSIGSAIQIQGRRVVLEGGSSIFTASTASTQPGGALNVTATDAMVVRQQSRLRTVTYSFSRAGDITLSTQQLDIRTGGQVGSSTYSQGRGGDVKINALESVTVADIARSLRSPIAERLSFLYAQSNSLGRAGNLRLETKHLQVGAGGLITTNAFNQGDAGNLTVQASDITLSGIALDIERNPLSSYGLPVSAGLFVGTGTTQRSRGNSGTLNVETRRLSLRDGAILQASTYSRGRAGDVNVHASESIEVSGTSAERSVPARIVATSGGIPQLSTPRTRRATGRGGNLNIATNNLTVEDGGIIAVSSLNPNAPDTAGAGTIRIQANRISLDNGGQLNAQTESGNRAGIQLEDVDLLTLQRNSDISTSAGLESGRGKGGDISIDAALILDAPSEDSDITANAKQEDAGNINIDAQGILGVSERPQPTVQSDITATSESGVSGEINISNPTVDPTQGIVELPSTIVDASRLIAQNCRAGNRAADQLGEFVVTGRGGLPPDPTDLRSSQAVITDWATLEPSQDDRIPGNVSSRTAEANRPAVEYPVIEAQGWVVGENGKVNLVAQAPVVTPRQPNWTLPNCLSQLSSKP